MNNKIIKHLNASIKQRNNDMITKIGCLLLYNNNKAMSCTTFTCYNHSEYGISFKYNPIWGIISVNAYNTFHEDSTGYLINKTDKYYNTVLYIIKTNYILYGQN